LTRPVKARLDCFRRTPENLADIGMGKFFEFGKNERHAKLLGQDCDRAPDSFGAFLGF
jgi:hypothetical protein